MRLLLLTTALLLAAILLAGCAQPLARPLVAPLRYADGPAGRCPTEDAPFRTTAPVLDPAAPAPRPTLQRFTLDDGMQLVVVERHGFPLVAARLYGEALDLEVGDVGSRRASYVTGVFLSPAEGTLRARGSCGTSACSITATAQDVPTALARIADLAAPREADVVYQQRLDVMMSGEERSARDPGASFRRIVARELFGDRHRYGATAPTQVPSLAELKAHVKRAFEPARATLVVVGDVRPDDVRAEAAKLFGARSPGAARPAVSDPPPPVSGPRLVAYHVPPMKQVTGAILARGPLPSAPDYPAFQVMVELLGGTPSSEAMQRVREDMTAAYSVSSSMSTYVDATVLSLGGSFARERAIDAMEALLESVRKLREDVPPPDAVAMAARSVAAKWRRTLGTDEGVAGALTGALAQGVPIETPLDVPSRASAVTPAQVHEAARRYLDVGLLRIVLMGNPEFLVQAQALRFGAPTRVDGYGRPL